jgi:hypothetical protein
MEGLMVDLIQVHMDHSLHLLALVQCTLIVGLPEDMVDHNLICHQVVLTIIWVMGGPVVHLPTWVPGVLVVALPIWEHDHLIWDLVGLCPTWEVEVNHFQWDLLEVADQCHKVNQADLVDLYLKCHQLPLDVNLIWETVHRVEVRLMEDMVAQHWSLDRPCHLHLGGLTRTYAPMVPTLDQVDHSTVVPVQ